MIATSRCGMCLAAAPIAARNFGFDLCEPCAAGLLEDRLDAWRATVEIEEVLLSDVGGKAIDSLVRGGIRPDALETEYGVDVCARADGAPEPTRASTSTWTSIDGGGAAGSLGSVAGSAGSCSSTGIGTSWPFASGAGSLLRPMHASSSATAATAAARHRWIGMHLRRPATPTIDQCDR